MISLSNFSSQQGGRVLFENVSLQFNSNRRYGLVGANGSGKSTLIRILSGQESHYDGKFHFPKDSQLGYLEQNHYLYEDDRVVDVVIGGREQLAKLLLERKKLESQDSNEKNSMQLAELEESLEELEAYRAEADACRLLDGLGVADANHFEKMKILSGGYRLRVLLARVLFQNPDILLLDEPTNHLDIISIDWLENYLLKRYRGTLVVISHDRDFLNHVCSDIADIDYQTITLYKGNFDKFIITKEEHVRLQEKENEKKLREVKHIEAFVEKFRAKATKARQAQSRIKQLEKIEIPEIIQSSRRKPLIRFEFKRPSGKEALSANNLSMSYDGNSVFSDISFSIKRGDKVAIVGANGTGKSTLMNIISGDIKPTSGQVVNGFEASISYLTQDFKSNIGSVGSVESWLHDKFATATISQIRGALGGLLFSGDDVSKPIKVLSGGESCRLMLAKIYFEKSNIILLDEPTNHLDLESITELEKALKKFDGTVVIVSHDKRFVANVAERIWTLKENKLIEYDGGYNEYIQKIGEDYLSRDNIVKEKKVTSSSSSDRKNIYTEKKKLRSLIQKNKKLISDNEKLIASKEAELDEIEKTFSDSSYYQSVKPEQIGQLEKKKNEIISELEKLLLEWEQLEKLRSSHVKELEALTI